MDYEACMMYFVSFPQNVDIQQFLELSDSEFEHLIDEVSHYSIMWASGYSDNGSVLYLCDSLVRIDRHNDQLIKPVDTSDMSDVFWSTIGVNITKKLQNAKISFLVINVSNMLE